MRQEGFTTLEIILMALLFVIITAVVLSLIFFSPQVGHLGQLSAGSLTEPETAGDPIQPPVFHLYDHNEAYYRNLGAQYFEQADYQQAATLFSYAIALNPNEPSHYLNRSRAYMEIQMLPLAADDLNKAVAMTALPSSYSVHFYNLGNHAFNLGLYEQAVTYFTRTAQLQPEDPINYYLIARTYEVMGNAQTARDYYEYVITLSPELGYDIVLNWGVQAQIGENHVVAVQHFNRAADLFPGESRAYQHRAISFYALGHKDFAMNDLLTALQLAPANPDVYRDFGWYYIREGDMFMADAYYRQAAALTTPT